MGFGEIIQMGAGLFAAAIIAVFGGAGCATNRTEGADRCLASFPVAESQPLSPLVVPVTILGDDYGFVVDTGTTLTVYDSAFRPLLGEPVSVESVRTASGTVPFELFRAPEARLASLPMRPETPVACTDLSSVREAIFSVSGREIYGIIGMDFLRQHVVRIDFDNGRVAILDAGARDEGSWGHAVPIEYFGKGVPVVTASLPQGNSEPFILDTGDASTGDLRDELYDALQRDGIVTPRQSISCATGAGMREAEEGIVESLQVGPFRHEDLPLLKSTWNGLGLGYLTRYNVTLDFPNGRLYLQRRAATMDARAATTCAPE